MCNTLSLSRILERVLRYEDCDEKIVTLCDSGKKKGVGKCYVDSSVGRANQ